MRTITIVYTFIFSMLFSSSFSQNIIKIKEIIFIDEEYELIRDSFSTTLIKNEDFLRLNYRHLLFDIEIPKSDSYIDFNVSNMKVYMDSSECSIPLIDCGIFNYTDSSIHVHAYCVFKDSMIPGGQTFIHDDAYENFKNLHDILQQSLRIIYSTSDKSEQYDLEIPQLTIISPQLSYGEKNNIRHEFCPCSTEERWK